MNTDLFSFSIDRGEGILFRKVLLIILLISICSFLINAQHIHHDDTTKLSYAIAIHGGAGDYSRSDIDSAKTIVYRSILENALQSGEEILKNGGSALDAVEKVIVILEDSPYFNAGKGAVFTNLGRNELDASIMDGRTMKAGAVAGVTDIKNPIKAAMAVMNHSKHVMMSGNGASMFAKEQKLEIVDTSYFFTREHWEGLQKVKKMEQENGGHGTVGCVALDKDGNLAAGTSKGGMTNKRYGRIGDSPVIGAGTYADNTTCAVSCTGHGEYFIRYAVAHSISAMMEYTDSSLQQASDYIIQNKLKGVNGSGGIIAVDKSGNISFSFNTQSMFRGYATSKGDKKIYLFGWPE